MVFKKKSFFKIGMWHSRPPPPFMTKAILSFHFDYLKPSLRYLEIPDRYFCPNPNLIFWNPFLFIFLWTEIKRITMGIFFLMHVLHPCAAHNISHLCGNLQIAENFEWNGGMSLRGGPGCPNTRRGVGMLTQKAARAFKILPHQGLRWNRTMGIMS